MSRRVFVVFLFVFFLSSAFVFSEEVRLTVIPFNRTCIVGGRKNILPRLYRYKEGRKKKKRIPLSSAEYFLDKRLIRRAEKKPFYLSYNFLTLSNGVYPFEIRVKDQKGKAYRFFTNITVSNVRVLVRVRLREPLPAERRLYLAGNAPSLSPDPDHWNPHGAVFRKLSDLEYETSFWAGLNNRVALELNLGSWAIKGRNQRGDVLHSVVKIKKADQLVSFNVDNWGKLKGHLRKGGIVLGFTGDHQDLILVDTRPESNQVELLYTYGKSDWKRLRHSGDYFSKFFIPFRGGSFLTYTLSPFRETNRILIPKEKKDFTFLVVGDVRLNKNSSVLPLMAKETNVSFVIDTGDMVFSGLNAGDWSSFFSVQAPILKNFLYQPAVGNHEEESPFYEKVTGRPFWYDFRWGEVLFIHLNDNSPFEPGTSQYTFLTNVLEKNRQYKFKVVSFHIPIYTSRVKGLNIDGIRYLAPVFEKYGVDLVFSGDDHGYEATHPIKEGKVHPKGVIYVISAGGGAPLYHITKRGFWNRFDRKCFHYIRVNVGENQMEVEAVDDKGKVFDRFEIKK